MTHLAIECSGTAGSVALYAAVEPLGYTDLAPDVGSVQTLAGEIQALVRAYGRPSFISVTYGPGSFTGLRVGLSTAKMLALAWKIPIVTVNTLHAIALRAARTPSGATPWTAFIPVINAFRKQVFSTAIAYPYRFDISATELPPPTVLAASQVLDAQVWQAAPLEALGVDVQCVSSGGPVAVCGPGLNTFPLHPTEPGNYRVVPAEFWNPSAAEVALLGWQEFQAGRLLDPFSLQPLYLRASAAEEVALQKRPASPPRC
jgi:tRNA threonylcarbamoyladenosine biosynthesis protein TsaB